jgi:hypothetical protein
VTKRGSNFYFWTGIVFLTGQVIFVPEWPNGEFVSLKLAAICWTKSLLLVLWPHSVFGQNHLCVKVL